MCIVDVVVENTLNITGLARITPGSNCMYYFLIHLLDIFLEVFSETTLLVMPGVIVKDTYFYVTYMGPSSCAKLGCWGVNSIARDTADIY